MKKALEITIKYLVYLSFLVPLIVLPSSFIFPFIVPKILAFRSLVLLMTAGYVCLCIAYKKEYLPRLSGLNQVVLLFWISFAMSTFLGVDAYHSFWDNHERMLGLFTITHYIIYYFILSSYFKKWTEWNRALKFFLVAGSLVMLFGVMQIVDPNFLMNNGSNRIAGTLGNAIYLGGYGLFLFFVSALLLVKEKDSWWKVGEALMGLLALVGLFYSGTRGSILGLLAGIFATVVGYLILFKGHPKTRKVAGGVIVGIFLIFAFLFVNRQRQWVINMPAIGRLMSTTLSGDTATRLIAWKIAVQAWEERPVFGWGPNNFFYAFNKYYNPKSLEFGYGETWFDNAHNIIVNTLAVQGAFGLLVYLSIFGVAIWMLFKNKKLREENYHFVIIAAAFLVAHLVHNITVFEDPTSYLYFMFWLAMINSMVTNSRQNEEKGVEKVVKPLGYPIVIVSYTVSLAALLLFNVVPARANMNTLKAISLIYRGNTAAIAPALEKIFSSNSPHIDDIRSDIARTYTQLLINQKKQTVDNTEKDTSLLVYSNLQKNLQLHPLDIRNHLLLAQLAQALAVRYSQTSYISDSYSYLKQALELSPNRQQILYSLSMLDLQVGRNSEAVDLLKQALNSDPNIAESYWRLAYTYYMTGQEKLAKDTLVEAKAKNLTFDDQGKQITELITANKNTKKK